MPTTLQTLPDDLAALAAMAHNNPELDARNGAKLIKCARSFRSNVTLQTYLRKACMMLKAYLMHTIDLVRKTPQTVPEFCYKLHDYKETEVSVCSNVIDLGVSRGVSMRGPEILPSLVRLLRFETTTVLDLKNNWLGDDDVIRLAEHGLTANRCLKTLVLQGNCIRAKSAAALSDAIASGSFLKSLDLQYNELNYFGMRALAPALAGSMITHINLSSNNLGPESAKLIASVLKSAGRITSLDLSNNAIEHAGAEALTQGVAAQSKLTSLAVTCCQLGAKGAHALASAVAVSGPFTSLELGSNRFGQDTVINIIKEWEQRKNMVCIQLQSCDIQSRGAEVLAEYIFENRSLTHLDLSHNHLGRMGAAALAVNGRHSAIKTLLLTHNSIGDAGVQALKDTFCSNGSLSDLDLSSNRIGIAGAKTLGTMLSDESGAANTLKTLNVSNNWLFEEGVAALASGVAASNSLTELNINQCHGISVMGIAKAITDSKSLQCLRITSTRHYGADVATLAQLIRHSIALRRLFVGRHLHSHPDMQAACEEKNVVLSLYGF